MLQHILIVILVFILLTGCQAEGNFKPALTVKFDTARVKGSLHLGAASLAGLSAGHVAGKGPDVAQSEDTGDGWQKICLEWNLDKPVQQDELTVRLDLQMTPDFWWAPHLVINEGDCIAQHVFRSPALIAAQGKLTLVLVPDLDICGKVNSTPWFLDIDVPKRQMFIGLSHTNIWTHVGYRKAPGMELPAGKVQLGFYIKAYEDTTAVPNPWREVCKLLWSRWGHELFVKGEPLTTPMDRYVKRTYEWAFQSWPHVWQEFDLNGRKVGAPQFIVNISESPNYPGPWYQREMLSIWNQAWFSSLRSASGVMRWAKRSSNTNLKQKAGLTKELALAAPMKEGFFPAVIRTDSVKELHDGQEVWRPKGWDHAYWSNSDRCPWNFDVTNEWYHVLDASWTGLLMLRWYEELEQDMRLLDYTRRYADALLKLQDEAGFFPGWLNPETLIPTDVMFQTPETSMSVTFLLKLSDLTGEAKYRQAAFKAMDAVLKEIVPAGRWTDFETYWSCCGFGKDKPETIYPRCGMYKQCSFSMFWTAEALLACYQAGGDERYLHWGRRTLDELSMLQQTWQPPYIYIPALGGFGVMNFDGEWNDSRQSLFAELFLDYYRVTGEPDLFERGIAALKASFVMMYCPENAATKALWEKVHPFFGPADYGFMMENYGHGGETSPEGMGIGVFTIYDWGNGAASEARNRIRDHYGDVYIDRKRGQAFGLDSIAVTLTGSSAILKDLAAKPRIVRIMFDDRTTRELELNGETTITW
ncbi:MAG: hypothetical protein JW709_01765 [Sedimentisphaerales bacterium]|nr:hypothetical protein [Sedimentisphaerales bacterium]